MVGKGEVHKNNKWAGQGFLQDTLSHVISTLPDEADEFREQGESGLRLPKCSHYNFHF